MDTPAVKLPIHEHPLFPIVRHTLGECKGCHLKEPIYGGYICNQSDCYTMFHKKCAKASLEMDHPSHPQHPLLLTKDSGDGPCDLCGEKLLPPCYSCSTCEFKVDLACGMKPSPPTIEHPMCHDHPLVFLKKREEEVPCELCKDSIGGRSFSCLECDVYFHVDCVHLSKEVNHPRHSNHPLKLIAFEELTYDAEKICLLCGEQPKNVLYHCSICNFTTCLGCTKNPPPLVIEHAKTHKHPLILFSKRISFICDICGNEGRIGPYLCLQCDLAFHAMCFGLPRVIHINRHDHRISFTHYLGPGYLKCGVCRQNLSQYHGAYSCSICPNYAVHPRCGTKIGVWNGDEVLEGAVEDDFKDIAPFKVVGDNLISHFSHDKHPLRLHQNNVIDDEFTRCEACILPVGFGPIYSCGECHFILHEKCANLPMKKRLVFTTTIFTLVGASSNGVHQVLDCQMCGKFSIGFKYTSRYIDVDVLCSSLSEPFFHESHVHPLYFDDRQGSHCNGCNKKVDGHVLRDDSCGFDLCLSCANLPKRIKHSNDEHSLSLCYGETASGKYWCDICERELDPRNWFYTSDCGVTFHANCVVGDFSLLMPGAILTYRGYPFEVVLNNHNTRPICCKCGSRCKVSVILKYCDIDNVYLCSRFCFLNLFLI